jgi:hypothetical protein
MVSWSEVEGVIANFRTCVPVAGKSREWCVNKKAIAWERPLSKKDIELLGAWAPNGPVMAVHVQNLDVRGKWLKRGGPFFISRHFASYPAVLVELEKAELSELTELLNESYEFLLARDHN